MLTFYLAVSFASLLQHGVAALRASAEGTHRNGGVEPCSLWPEIKRIVTHSPQPTVSVCFFVYRMCTAVLSVNGQAAAMLSHEAITVLFKKQISLALVVKRASGGESSGPAPRRGRAKPPKVSAPAEDMLGSFIKKEKRPTRAPGQVPGYMATTKSQAERTKKSSIRFEKPLAARVKHTVTMLTAAQAFSQSAQRANKKKSSKKKAGDAIKATAPRRAKPEPSNERSNPRKASPPPAKKATAKPAAKKKAEETVELVFDLDFNKDTAAAVEVELRGALHDLGLPNAGTIPIACREGIIASITTDSAATAALIKKSRKALKAAILSKLTPEPEPVVQEPVQARTETVVPPRVTTPEGAAPPKSPSPSPSPPSSSNVQHVHGTVSLPDRKFGFNIRGGSDTPDNGVFISKVSSGGNLERDGRFRVGDRITAVNGINLAGRTHSGVIEIIQQDKTKVTLDVEREAQEVSPSLKSVLCILLCKARHGLYFYCAPPELICGMLLSVCLVA